MFWNFCRISKLTKFTFKNRVFTFIKLSLFGKLIICFVRDPFWLPEIISWLRQSTLSFHTLYTRVYIEKIRLLIHALSIFLKHLISIKRLRVPSKIKWLTQCANTKFKLRSHFRLVGITNYNLTVRWCPKLPRQG